MVKWMYYLAVAMLLAAAADAAAVSVDVPAAVVDAGAVDVPAVAVDSSTVITLEKFSWIEETTKRGDTKYKSLEITIKDDPAITITSGTCNIVYKEGEIDYDQEGTLANLVCTIDLVTAEKTALPVGPIEYLLGVTDDNGEDHYTGSATFEVNPTEFVPATGTIGCGAASSYTRTVVDTAPECVGGKYVALDDPATKYACYVPVGEGDKSRGEPNGEGCLPLDDTSHASGANPTIEVCLSDKVSVTIGARPSTIILANSLTYETPSLGITYTDDAPGTALIMELIVQDKADPKTFFVGAIPSPAAGDLDVPILDYVPTSATYQVCGVLSATPSTTESVVETVESTAATPTEITDLNVFMVKDTDANLVEFGFNNAQKDPHMYFATLDNPTEKVGINCDGVEDGHTCYGFLTPTNIDVDITLTVGYGNKEGSDFGDPANMIIGTLPA